MMKGKGQGGGEGRLVCLIKPGLCMFVAADERGRDTIYTCLIYDREVAIFATGTSVGLPGCVCVYMCVCSFAWSPWLGFAGIALARRGESLEKALRRIPLFPAITAALMCARVIALFACPVRVPPARARPL